MPFTNLLAVTLLIRFRVSRLSIINFDNLNNPKLELSGFKKKKLKVKRLKYDIFTPCMANKEIAIIGGGAAGFFAALSAASYSTNTNITLYEKTNKLLSKVKVSGGGRCNVTNHCFKIAEFASHYPRGSKFMKKCLGEFDSKNTIEWFQSRGVRLKAETDNRMFPITDDSQTIIDCLTLEAKNLGVPIINSMAISEIKPIEDGFLLTSANGEVKANKVIVASGGSPKAEGLSWLRQLGHNISSPVPSLFTFNMPGNEVTQLMGLSVDHTQVKVQGSKLVSDGPLLITHWGMSGPAILKLSAWGARELNEKEYHFSILVSWVGKQKEDGVREIIFTESASSGKRKISNRNPLLLPQRLWCYLLNKVGLNEDKVWSEMSKKDMNRLINILTNDEYEVKGKTTFKEEFVTCGGVALEDIDHKTMESKQRKGMYFCGEVMDIDGITGGFNFQAAWTTGYIAGKNAALSLQGGQ